MLDWGPSTQRVSTGIDALDAALGGLFWGDNVVWELDSVPEAPFYAAIAGAGEAFETRTYVSLGTGPDPELAEGLDIVRAGPGTALAKPADLLAEIHRRCQPHGRRLLLFKTLDAMCRVWGVTATRAFFARCCPMLLELGAIAYWSISARSGAGAVRETVEAVTQCVLAVDERSVRVSKAEGRPDGAAGSVLHWHLEAGRAVLAPAELMGRIAASLRAVRRARGLNQHELAQLAGVTGSAMSQAERAERGLSLATLVRLSSALGCTLDELLRGEEREPYRIGRRLEEPAGAADPVTSLLTEAQGGLHVDLVHLRPREAAAPAPAGPRRAIIAVASGLVQIQIAGRTPALRHGEVLVAAADRVEGWRNLGQTDAALFWIVTDAPAAP